jgi:hypothetical protein
VFTASSIYLSLYPMFNGYCGEFIVMNVITFILSRFRDKLEKTSYSFEREFCFIVFRNYLNLY